MPGNGGVRAVKRRKKPVQKIVKLPPVKTNPSKRHRDRLNVELDHLTHLLPLAEEVRGRLDKLSVLRLSVGYLKAKSYFHAALQNRSAPADSVGGQSVSLDGVGFSEGDLLLQALNGFVLVVTADGTVFYTSPTVLDFLGFHQSDVVHQSLYELVHLDDREMFRCQLYFSFNTSEEESKAASRQNRALLPQYIPPENSSFLERSFCCRLRCLLDNTSGFLALNFNGRLKYLHLEKAGADGTPPQLALFAIATPVQPPSVMKIRTKTLIFQTKHSMDFAPLGVDTRGKLVLGYSEIELVTPGSGYQFIHAADMMYCADNHLRMMKTGDSGFTFFRLLTKTREWLWVQASARVVFKGGRPDFIIARQKALRSEEGEEHFQRRRQQLPFNVTTGEGVLYDTWMDAYSNPDPPGSGVPDSTEPRRLNALDPASLLGSLRRQDLSLYSHPQKAFPELPAFPDVDVEDLDWEQPRSSLERAFLDSRALLSVPGQNQTSPKAPVTVELTSDAVVESLEQILGDIGRGGMEDIAVEEQELREWEKTLVRMNNQRQESSGELNRILATDVFSYVEEALRREFGGFVQDHPQGQHEQLVTDRNSGYLGQALRGNGSGGPKALRFPDPHQTNSCRLWPPSTRRHLCGGCGVSSTCRQDATQRSWLFHGQSGSDATDRTQYCQRQPEPWSAPERRQLPQSFHRHPLMHSSHPQSPPPRLQTLRLPGSCMYEKREGHILYEANLPVRQNGPVSGSRGPVHVAGATSNSPFTLSHPDPGVGAMQASASVFPHLSSRTDVGNIGLLHLSGEESGPGASYHPEHEPFFCCNREAQSFPERRR